MGEKKGGVEEYRAWCLQNFSRVLCVDEVHEGSRHILFATDPLLDATIAWEVVGKCDQAAIDAFLDEIKVLGFEPWAVITDGSPLYKQTLAQRWNDVEHQLCIFHVLAQINKDVLKSARSIRDELPKPKKRRRGPPCKRGRPRENDEWRAFASEHLYLLVKRLDRFTQEDLEDWARMVEIDARFETLKAFVDDVHGLFEKGITQKTARLRHTLLMNKEAYTGDPDLERAMRRLAPEKFDKMIVFMNYTNLDRTNNHVERGNRSFRMLQKTRYRRRRRRTILLALELHVLRRWRKHPLYLAHARRAKRLRRRPRRYRTAYRRAS